MPEKSDTLQVDQIDARRVEGWLVFACPECQSPIKVAEEDALHILECPTCHSAFEPLIDSLPENGAGNARAGAAPLAAGFPAASADRICFPVRKQLKSILPERRQTSGGGGFAGDLARPDHKKEFHAKSFDDDNNLPIRNLRALELRQIEASKDRPLHPPTELAAESTAYIEEQSGSKNKRVKVRTRRKRRSERQRALRFYILAALGASVIGFVVFLVVTLLHQGEGEYVNENEYYSNHETELQGEYVNDPKMAMLKFLQAETLTEKLNYVRRASFLASKMRAYYTKNGIPTYQVRDILMTSAWDLPPGSSPERGINREQLRKIAQDLPPGFSLGRVLVANHPAMTFYVENTDDYGYRIDWESFVASGSMSWEDFISNRPSTPQRLRVIASPADYYVEFFQNTDLYYCLKLQDRTGKHTIYGYLREDKSENMKLRDHLVKWGADRKLILDVRFPDGSATDNQVEILRLVRTGWLQP